MDKEKKCLEDLKEYMEKNRKEKIKEIEAIIFREDYLEHTQAYSRLVGYVQGIDAVKSFLTSRKF